MIETGAGAANPGSAVSKLSSLLISWHAAPRATASNAMALVAAALHGDEEYGSAVLLVRDARRAASFIRERLSTDTWRLIGDLNRTLTVDMHGALAEAEAYERADAALRIIAAISGLARKHEQRRRLAYLQCRPADRPGNRHLPFCPPFRQRRGTGR